MTEAAEPFGFLAVDKPRGWTSHDIVAKVRRGTGVKRVGHAGTLDPMATGMLILCIGAATRLSEYVMHTDKLYIATVRLGVETDTYDAEGQVVATKPINKLTREALDFTLSQFSGEIEQVPPMFSAIKQNGKKLYELARAGKEVERAPRTVHIHAIHIYEWEPPDAKIVVWCSSGTYIRSIAHDWGHILGVGGHLTELHRRIVGSFQVMTPWEELLNSFDDGSWTQYIRSEFQALQHIPAIYLDAAQTDDMQHGRPISRMEDIGSTPLRRAYADDDGLFLGIVEAKDHHWQPIKVFG
ncbi:MAG: tRNA pseudouridine(55) synthase TruB [Anaerolineae bacterium]|nr:tRNA pseudouridine(55) synthase TruB [Anaerolineae bacterium]